MPLITSKKSSSPTNNSISTSTTDTKRAVSIEGIAGTAVTNIKKESSSGFNYQSLTESTPTNAPKLKTKTILPVRSHSSTNAELAYHLQQLKNLGKRKTTTSGDDQDNHNDERIHLTSSNLKVECDDNKIETSIYKSTEPEKQETNLELNITKTTKAQKPGGERDAWDHKIEFLLAVIGYAVDLGNVWRFPTTVYMNGGGAFFIPYFALLIFGGLPLFYMELALGQFHRSGIFTVWRHICPLVKGVGWATLIINFMMAMFYNTIISWAVFYFVMSFNSIGSELPWKHCGHSWNTKCCVAADITEYQSQLRMATLPKQVLNKTIANQTALIGKSVQQCQRLVYSTEEYFYRRLQEVDKADGFNDLGQIKWELALYLFIVFFIVYFALWKGIKSSGKAVWITAIAPYIVLFILLIRGVTLSGASIGIKFYLEPNLELLKSLSIWNAAATQIFFSLGPGFGVLLALSSYNKFHNNCYRDALLTSTINSATSILAGFVVFSTLGHMAKVSSKTIQEVIDEKGSELVFIVYPHIIALMDWSVLWSILFFFMLITLGIDSTFGGLESIITGLCDEFPNVFGRRRSLFVLGVLIICYLGALPTCTYGGDYIVNLMNEVAVAPAILVVVLFECVAVSWFYGVNRLADDIKAMIGTRPSLFWRAIWYVISPIFLMVLFYISLENVLLGNVVVKGIQLRKLPKNVQVWSYLMIFVPILCIPVYAIYKLLVTPGKDFDARLQLSMKPEQASHGQLHTSSNKEQEGEEKVEAL